jgi:TRAP-type C4-dicarboxylate transport system substrate-binding protein
VCAFGLRASLALAADPVPEVLRIATVAPDGSDFAREFRAFAREVATTTDGAVEVKWIFDGIAGSELEVASRIERGQLDGTASGGMLCSQLSPTMRAMRIAGLVETADEAAHVLSRAQNDIRADFAAAGMHEIGTPLLGSDLLFLRRPATTLAEIKKLRLWRWDLDATGRAGSEAIGLQVVAAPLESLNRMLDDNQVDGFIAIPSGALAFQWWAHTREVLRMPMGFLAGCLLISQGSWDRLPIGARQQVESAAAKAMVRMTDLMRRDEGLLLGGLFQRGGLEVHEPSAALRAEYLTEAHSARDRISAASKTEPLMGKLLQWLADFRGRYSVH